MHGPEPQTHHTPPLPHTRTQTPFARLARILQANAYADPWQDLASSTTRGEAPAALAALFPLFSFANHSCCPNAAHVVVGGTRPLGGGGLGGSSSGGSSGSRGGVGSGANGDGGGQLDVLARPGVGPRMVVRAAQRILPGQEVSVNYLGRGALAPAAERRAALAAHWGFECRCPRCAAELKLPQAVRDAAEATALCAAEEAPEVAAAAAAGDARALEAAADRLLARMARLEAACARAALPPVQQRLALGAAYEAQHVLASAYLAQDPAVSGAGLQGANALAAFFVCALAFIYCCPDKTD